MAISPMDLDILSEEDLAEVDSWEPQIDRALRLVGNGTIVDIPGVSRRIRLELIRRYDEVGWIVHHHSGYRECDYLRFLLPEF